MKKNILAAVVATTITMGAAPVQADAADALGAIIGLAVLKNVLEPTPAPVVNYTPPTDRWAPVKTKVVYVDKPVVVHAPTYEDKGRTVSLSCSRTGGDWKYDSFDLDFMSAGDTATLTKKDGNTQQFTLSKTSDSYDLAREAYSKKTFFSLDRATLGYSMEHKVQWGNNLENQGTCLFSNNKI